MSATWRTVGPTGGPPAPTAAAPLASAWPAPTADGLRSAMYEGILTHRRYGPGPSHSFTYRVAMPLIDLEEVDRVARLHPLMSATRSAPVRFARSDFLGDPGIPLDQAVCDVVEANTGHRPQGPVAMLANLRTWGWQFNPISLYFCAAGSEVGNLVAEVQNTPWHERTAYVVGGPGEHRFAKRLHVSPFLPMEVDYVLRYDAPGPQLTVSFDVLDGEDRILAARLALRRRPIDRTALGRLIWTNLAPSHRVSAGIYAQAARLGYKGAPFFTHPSKRPAGSNPRSAHDTRS